MTREGDVEGFDYVFDQLVIEALQGGDLPPDETLLAATIIDSLALVSLVMRIEDEFATPWPLEKITNIGQIRTVGALREWAREAYLGELH